MIRMLMLVGIFVGSVLALGSCHYNEEQLWEECCILKVYTDETSSSEGRARSSSWVPVASSTATAEQCCRSTKCDGKSREPKGKSTASWMAARGRVQATTSPAWG